MGSTFGIYSVALSGMYVNQTGLAVTSNNLVNINTPGASRTRMISEEKVVSGVTAGSGAGVQTINRIRSQFLDKTYRQQNGELNYWAVKSNNLTEIEAMLNEYSTDDSGDNTGLQQMIQDFFDSWEELANDPGSSTNRQAVLEEAELLIAALADIDQQLQQLQQDCCDRVTTAVDTLNDLAAQVAELNTQISKLENSGVEASSLRDERDNLLDQMSVLTNITVSEKSDGAVDVTIGGTPLVTGSKTNELAVSGTGSGDDPLTVQWAKTGSTADITSGSLKAYLENANQSDLQTFDATDAPYNYTAGSGSSIANVRQALNVLITTVAVEINALHSSGQGLDGTTGLDFFVAIDDSQPLSISNITINSAILEDTDKIAAGATADAGDSAIAGQICALADASIFEYDGLSGDLNSFYQSFISWLGTTGANASSYYDTCSSLVEQADNQRQSLSSISMDEELSNMIMYQNAYSANARVVSVIDGLLADLIEDLG